MLPIIVIFAWIIAIVVPQVILTNKIENNYANEDEQEKRINMLIAAQFLFWVGIICCGAWGVSITKNRTKHWLLGVGCLGILLGCMFFHSCYTDDLFITS